MNSLLQMILGVVLKLVWGRAEDWISKEIRYLRNKRILINEVKDVAKEVAKEHEVISSDRESIDDSLLRLERAIRRRSRSGDAGTVESSDREGTS